MSTTSTQNNQPPHNHAILWLVLGASLAAAVVYYAIQLLNAAETAMSY